MVESVFLELTVPETRNRIDFQTAPLPPATGDPILLPAGVDEPDRQLRSKFSSKRAQPKIEIGCQRLARRGRVFHPRQRGGFDWAICGKAVRRFPAELHIPPAEFEGTGRRRWRSCNGSSTATAAGVGRGGSKPGRDVLFYVAEKYAGCEFFSRGLGADGFHGKERGVHGKNKAAINIKTAALYRPPRFLQ